MQCSCFHVGFVINDFANRCTVSLAMNSVIYRQPSKVRWVVKPRTATTTLGNQTTFDFYRFSKLGSRIRFPKESKNMIEPLAHLEINRRHRFPRLLTFHNVCISSGGRVDRRRRRRRKINTARKTFASRRRRNEMLRRNVFSFGVNGFLAFDVNFVISRTFPVEMIHCLFGFQR